jgi:ABC-type multidrug transport system fused ATPase/permease subunit
MDRNGESEDKNKPLKKYLSFVKPYRFTILIIIGLGMLQFAVPLVGPWMTKVMIDDVLMGVNGFWTIEKVVLLLGIVYVSGVIINFIRNYITAHLGNRMVVDIRRKLYQHMQSLSQRFYDSRQIGSIVSRVLHDVNGAQNLVGGGVINLVVDLFLVIFAAVMMFILDMKLALLSLWILPLYYLTFTNLNVRIRFAWRSVHRQMERISGVLVERLGGMKVVQSFNRENTELERFDKQSQNHYKYSMSAHLLSNTLGAISQSFNHIGGLIIWFFGGYAVLNGHLKLGELVAFQAYMSQLYGPIQRFSQVNVTIQNSMSNVERIFEVFDIQPEIKNKENAIPLKHCMGDIRFEKVSFTYVSERPVRGSENKNGDPDLAERVKPFKKFYLLPPKTKPDPPPVKTETHVALTDISFHARPGEVIALVGPSGAGKSTLINFIPRFYDPDEGHVLLDDKDLRDYDVNDLRKHIALVLQDNILFSGTVYENIAYGLPDATHEQVIAAARSANAHDFIMEFDQQYETVLGERGVRLSGGQKQRIAIARALLKNPQILILDEATSALDAESESLVTEALEYLMKNRTTFVIAHRLATVVRADQILVMDHGQIVEKGTHEQLLKKNGLYRDLYEKQLKAMRPEELMKFRLSANG